MAGGDLEVFITAGIMATDVVSIVAGIMGIAPERVPGIGPATVPGTDKTTFTGKGITVTATPSPGGRRIGGSPKRLPTEKTMSWPTKAAMPIGAPATAGRSGKIKAGKKAAPPLPAAVRPRNPGTIKTDPVWNVTIGPGSRAAIEPKVISASGRAHPEGAVAPAGDGSLKRLML